MRNKLLVFSDLHIKEDWEDGLSEIKRIITKTFDNDKNCHQIIVFNGDTLDKPALMGSKASLHLQNLLLYLNNEVTQNCTVIFLQGTYSHDGNWLELMNKEYQEIEFINCIRKLSFTNDGEETKFLFIPELYDISKEEYQELLSERFNYIFGHGTVAGYFTSCKDKDETIERTLLSAPVFDRNSFNADFTIFGHYHNFVETKLENTHFMYVGSFFTNTFGEIDPKGKGALIIDNGIIYREPNLLDIRYEEIWIRNLDDISRCITLQNENIKVRAVISDDTLPTYIKTVVNTVRNIKDIRTCEEKINILEKKVIENSEDSETKNFLEEIFSTYNTKGLINTILLYAKENKISNIEEKFLLELEKNL